MVFNLTPNLNYIQFGVVYGVARHCKIVCYMDAWIHEQGVMFCDSNSAEVLVQPRIIILSQ